MEEDGRERSQGVPWKGSEQNSDREFLRDILTNVSKEGGSGISLSEESLRKDLKHDTVVSNKANTHIDGGSREFSRFGLNQERIRWKGSEENSDREFLRDSDNILNNVKKEDGSGISLSEESLRKDLKHDTVVSNKANTHIDGGSREFSRLGLNQERIHTVRSKVYEKTSDETPEKGSREPPDNQALIVPFANELDPILPKSYTGISPGFQQAFAATGNSTYRQSLAATSILPQSAAVPFDDCAFGSSGNAICEYLLNSQQESSLPPPIPTRWSFLDRDLLICNILPELDSMSAIRLSCGSVWFHESWRDSDFRGILMDTEKNVHLLTHTYGGGSQIISTIIKVSHVEYVVGEFRNLGLLRIGERYTVNNFYTDKWWAIPVSDVGFPRNDDCITISGMWYSGDSFGIVEVQFLRGVAMFSSGYSETNGWGVVSVEDIACENFDVKSPYTYSSYFENFVFWILSDKILLYDGLRFRCVNNPGWESIVRIGARLFGITGDKYFELDVLTLQKSFGGGDFPNIEIANCFLVSKFVQTNDVFVMCFQSILDRTFTTRIVLRKEKKMFHAQLPVCERLLQAHYANLGSDVWSRPERSFTITVSDRESQSRTLRRRSTALTKDKAKSESFAGKRHVKDCKED